MSRLAALGLLAAAGAAALAVLLTTTGLRTAAPGATEVHWGRPFAVWELRLTAPPRWETGYARHEANGELALRPLGLLGSYAFWLALLGGVPAAFLRLTRRRRRLRAAGVAAAALLLWLPVLFVAGVVGNGGPAPFATALALAGAFVCAVAVSVARGGRAARTSAAAVALAGLVLVGVLVSAVVPQRIESERELHSAWFGRPLPYVQADLGRFTPPGYPQEFGWNPWEDPAELHEVRFLASYGLVLAPVLALAAGLARLRRRPHVRR